MQNHRVNKRDIAGRGSLDSNLAGGVTQRPSMLDGVHSSRYDHASGQTGLDKLMWSKALALPAFGDWQVSRRSTPGVGKGCLKSTRMIARLNHQNSVPQQNVFVRS